MSSCVRWAGIALLAVFAVASPARAADSTATAPPKLTTGSIPGRAGIGGMIGGSWFVAAGDYSRGSRPRFDFSGSFRYQLRPGLRLQFSPGFTWNGYSKTESPPFDDPGRPGDLTKEHYLTLLVPISTQVQWTHGGRSWFHHVGIGPGIYRVAVQHYRKELKDARTFLPHRGLYLGGTLELGTERFFKSLPNTALELNAASHLVLARRDQQFRAGWNDMLGSTALRIGVNYYYDVARLKPKEQVPLPKSAGRKAGT